MINQLLHDTVAVVKCSTKSNAFCFNCKVFRDGYKCLNWLPLITTLQLQFSSANKLSWKFLTFICLSTGGVNAISVSWASVRLSFPAEKLPVQDRNISILVKSQENQELEISKIDKSTLNSYYQSNVYEKSKPGVVRKCRDESKTLKWSSVISTLNNPAMMVMLGLKGHLYLPASKLPSTITFMVAIPQPKSVIVIQPSKCKFGHVRFFCKREREEKRGCENWDEETAGKQDLDRHYREMLIEIKDRILSSSLVLKSKRRAGEV
nr:hypothetical protein Iba_chr12aCG10880 [Ipomoea batatas]